MKKQRNRAGVFVIWGSPKCASNRKTINLSARFIFALLATPVRREDASGFLSENQISSIVMEKLEKSIICAMRIISKGCKYLCIASSLLLFFRGPLAALVMMGCFAFLHIVYRDLAEQMEDQDILETEEE